MPNPSPSRSVNFSTVTCLSVFHLYLKASVRRPVSNVSQQYEDTGECWLCIPVSFILGVVQVGVRTSVQATAVQLPSAAVNPARLHATVGSVYALETGLSCEKRFCDDDERPCEWSANHQLLNPSNTP